MIVFVLGVSILGVLVGVGVGISVLVCIGVGVVGASTRSTGEFGFMELFEGKSGND